MINNLVQKRDFGKRERRSSNYSNVKINVGKMGKRSGNSENVCFKGKYLTRGDTLYSDAI